LLLRLDLFNSYLLTSHICSSAGRIITNDSLEGILNGSVVGYFKILSLDSGEYGKIFPFQDLKEVGMLSTSSRRLMLY
jgi:hypothetical protein